LKVGKEVNGDVHLDLGIDVLEKVLGSGCNSMLSLASSVDIDSGLLIVVSHATEDERKALASIFAKLYVTANADPEKLRTLQDLVTEAVDDKVLSDAPSRNSLSKLQAALTKVAATAAAAATVPEGQTAALETEATETVTPEEQEEEITMVEGMTSKLAIRTKTGLVDRAEDSLVSELLDDDEEEQDEDDTVS
jgi:condensin complex subunit 3